VNPSAFEGLLFEGAQIQLAGWTLIEVAGRDRERFLHSQLTSDVKGLAPGGSQMTALLDRSGRLQVFGFLLKRECRIELLVPDRPARTAVEVLEGHVISDDVSFSFPDVPEPRLALGAEAVRLLGDIPPDQVFPVESWTSRGFVVWGGAEQLDLPVMEASDLENLRVLGGLPRWGVEVDTGTPIHETTLMKTAVSADKGCYLGQETVAKVASGRGAARASVLLEIVDGNRPPDALVGQRFTTESGERAGEVLAVAGWKGLDYLEASVIRVLRVAGREIECRFEDDSAVLVRVHETPLLSAPDPEHWARRLTTHAAAAFAEDREEAAMTLFERAIAVCPQYADAYESLGVILGRHKRYSEAVDLMVRLLGVDPSSVMAHTNLSLYYNQLDRIEDAEREAAEAMRAKMGRDAVGRDHEEAARQESETAAAERRRRAEMFRQVLELDPDDAMGNFGLGELLVEEGRYAEAVDHLERALAADPNYSAALLALGRAHEGANDLVAACETYRRGVDVAAARGDLATANKMQERLVVLESRSTTG
jgi:folate-binding protein YgfZ